MEIMVFESTVTHTTGVDKVPDLAAHNASCTLFHVCTSPDFPAAMHIDVRDDMYGHRIDLEWLQVSISCTPRLANKRP